MTSALTLWGIVAAISLILSLVWFALYWSIARWLKGRKQLLVLLDDRMNARLLWRRPAREHEVDKKSDEPKKVSLVGSYRYHGPGAGLWIVDADTGDQVRMPPRKVRDADPTWTENARTNAHHYWELCNEQIDELINATGGKWDVLGRAVPWLILATLVLVVVVLVIVVRLVGGNG